jgi:uncharacterized RDD family membrane protein YckC
MADDQQQPGQPPAGAPGAWPPPGAQPDVAPQAPAGAPAGYPPQPGWSPPQPQPGWSPPQPQPGYPPQPQPGWSPPAYPPQPGYPGAYPPPPQGGYPPPPYGQPGGYPTPGYGYGPPNYAGFWIRLVAFILDGLILTAIIIVLAITIIGILAIIPVAIGYKPYLWWKRGASFGQSAMGLRVVRAVDGGPIDGSMAVLRFLGYIVSGWVFYLGFIWVAFEPRKRGWHDMMAGTVVIHIN